MKFKMAVEMEFEAPDTHTEKFKGYTDEFYEDLAKAIAEDIASKLAIVGIDVKYEDCSRLEEYERGYADGVLCFGGNKE